MSFQSAVSSPRAAPAPTPLILPSPRVSPASASPRIATPHRPSVSAPVSDEEHRDVIDVALEPFHDTARAHLDAPSVPTQLALTAPYAAHPWIVQRSPLSIAPVQLSVPTDRYGLPINHREMLINACRAYMRHLGMAASRASATAGGLGSVIDIYNSFYRLVDLSKQDARSRAYLGDLRCLAAGQDIAGVRYAEALTRLNIPQGLFGTPLQECKTNAKACIDYTEIALRRNNHSRYLTVLGGTLAVLSTVATVLQLAALASVTVSTLGFVLPYIVLIFALLNSVVAGWQLHEGDRQLALLGQRTIAEDNLDAATAPAPEHKYVHLRQQACDLQYARLRSQQYLAVCMAVSGIVFAAGAIVGTLGLSWVVGFALGFVGSLALGGFSTMHGERWGARVSGISPQLLLKSTNDLASSAIHAEALRRACAAVPRSRYSRAYVVRRLIAPVRYWGTPKREPGAVLSALLHKIRDIDIEYIGAQEKILEAELGVATSEHDADIATQKLLASSPRTQQTQVQMDERQRDATERLGSITALRTALETLTVQRQIIAGTADLMQHITRVGDDTHNDKAVHALSSILQSAGYFKAFNARLAQDRNWKNAEAMQACLGKSDMDAATSLLAKWVEEGKTLQARQARLRRMTSYAVVAVAKVGEQIATENRNSLLELMVRRPLAKLEFDSVFPG